MTLRPIVLKLNLLVHNGIPEVAELLKLTADQILDGGGHTLIFNRDLTADTLQTFKFKGTRLSRDVTYQQ